MNTHLIEHSPLDRPLVGTSVRTLPIRRIGGLEVPAAGAWPLLASSSVRIRSSRHDDLRYHRVFRRGHRMWAWFTASAS